MHEVVEQRTFEALDFSAVRERLAQYATFGLARTYLLALKPAFSPQEVLRRQDETAEGRRLLEADSNISFGAPGEIVALIDRAALDGMLTGLELLMVLQALDVVSSAKKTVTKHRSIASNLAAIAETIHDSKSLRVVINECIGPRGEVVDTATPKLSNLRREVREAYEQLTGSLERLIRSKRGRLALQEGVVSIRADRFVISVRAEMRGQIPGIVHDASNTGMTLYVEPFSTVELGNRWRELALEEEREVLRVLRELSALVGDMAVEIQSDLQALTDLDIALAKARFSKGLNGIRPKTTSGDGKLVALIQARHPLLQGEVVPVSLHIGPEWRALVVTGPNTGGKTAVMKTVGLFALMYQSGLQVPAAEGSVMPVFDGVYADVGDQQSILQSVSTFSSHIENVAAILGLATSSSLVLLDELGTGTDPEEGAALAQGVLKYLAERDVTTIVTTHHRAVAAFAEGFYKSANASVDLDPDTLQPNYRLTMGIPGRSYAFKVAERLKMPREILDLATQSMGPEVLRFDEMLSELEMERAMLQTQMKDAEDTTVKAEVQAKQLQAQFDEMAERREDLLEAMHRDAVAEYEGLRKKLKKVEASLSWNTDFQPDVEDVEEASREIEVVQNELRTLRNVSTPPVDEPVAKTTFRKGDLVDVHGLAKQGTIVDVNLDSDEAEVSVGNIRIRVGLHRISRAESGMFEPHSETVGIKAWLGPTLASADLDIRGLRVEDAMIRLDEFLDNAVRDGMSRIRVIHGRGTGALREAAREHLTDHVLVRTYRREDVACGADGVTLVELA